MIFIEIGYGIGKRCVRGVSVYVSEGPFADTLRHTSRFALTIG